MNHSYTSLLDVSFLNLTIFSLSLSLFLHRLFIDLIFTLQVVLDLKLMHENLSDSMKIKNPWKRDS